MDTLHTRIALALGWTPLQAAGFSLLALRDLVRPVDAALAEEITRHVESGDVLRLLDTATKAIEVKPAKPTPRLVCAIARDIRKDWGVKINYAAQPYLNAMLEAETIHDDCGYDSMKSIILYFLNNARSYRGEKAKALKAELKQLVGVK
ncbi:MAG: hypothetical protein WC729_29640 [Sphingomonas sp.]|jgi:hypothetical protein|uniref:hypothetical protein n=1 Tax=Sphingomonas sp. TaxID=28214 RepID=UPI0035693B20